MRPRPTIPSCMSTPVGRDRASDVTCDDGGSDDSGEVSERGHADLAVDVDAVEELVGELDDAAADDDQLRPDDVLQVLEIALEAVRPVLPGQVLLRARRVRYPRVGNVLLDVHMAQLGVRHQRA